MALLSHKPASINTATTPNRNPPTSDLHALTPSLHSDLDFNSNMDPASHLYSDYYSDYSYGSDYYSEYDYDSYSSFYSDYDLEIDPLPLHTTTTRYLRGRPATANPNPRGKHHRNPLPWSKRKLAVITGYEDDAAAYYRYLWKEQQEQKQQQQQHDKTTTTTTTTTTKNSPLPKNKNKPKKQRAKATKIPNPHFLTYLAANARRNRPWLRWACPCCVDLTRVSTLRERRRALPGLREEGVEMAREGLVIPRPIRGVDGGREEGRGSGRGVRVVRMGGEEDVMWGKERVSGHGGDEQPVVDGEYEVGPGFGLADIVRDEPVYSVRYKYSRGSARKVKGGDICKGAGSVLDVRLVEEVNGDEEWEMEWDFVDGSRRGDGERDGDDLDSEWTGVDMDGGSACSHMGSDEDPWEVLSDN